MYPAGKERRHMTLDEFRGTRRPIDDVRNAGRYSMDDSPPNPGYEYATGLYVSTVGPDWPEVCRMEGPYHLIVSNQEWIGELKTLEAILYDCFAFELRDEHAPIAGASEGLVA